MSDKLRILIIDDVPENLRVLGEMLETAGYEVLVAGSGLDAMRKVKVQPVPDLILLDVLMPSMDGFEVCQRLKSDPESRSIPVIFISAVGMTEQKLHAFRSGAVDYITKPFQSEEVVARVQAHLQLRIIEELKLEVAERKRAELELKNSQDKLAALTAELVLTEERERRRIAVALHDQVVQNLALGKLKLDQALKKGLISETAAITDLQGLLADSMNDLRSLCTDLSPPLLYELGLKEAVENFGERLSREHGIRFAISGDESITLREDLQVSLFQIVRELLVNVIKHSKASSVAVLASLHNGLVSIEVADDGVGIDPSSSRVGFGLAYIRQRVTFLDGTMHMFTSKGNGMKVVIEIPVNDGKRGCQ